MQAQPTASQPAQDPHDGDEYDEEVDEEGEEGEEYEEEDEEQPEPNPPQTAGGETGSTVTAEALATAPILNDPHLPAPPPVKPHATTRQNFKSVLRSIPGRRNVLDYLRLWGAMPTGFQNSLLFDEERYGPIKRGDPLRPRVSEHGLEIRDLAWDPATEQQAAPSPTQTLGLPSICGPRTIPAWLVRILLLIGGCGDGGGWWGISRHDQAKALPVSTIKVRMEMAEGIPLPSPSAALPHTTRSKYVLFDTGGTSYLIKRTRKKIGFLTRVGPHV
ncbi:hypothetical protein PAPYR_1704 [Paratrimastix pyriformis]|uniref:Uncharacterized protein n=1 Tax=Paratrimastix pyriformis TaxID=342808 RepID=A0ABQ8UW75_9EUKA|nr:hypothetical protein PAPYR_1704 [Paratrimastix pyriformis]